MATPLHPAFIEALAADANSAQKAAKGGKDQATSVYNAHLKKEHNGGYPRLDCTVCTHLLDVIGFNDDILTAIANLPSR